MVFAKLAKRGAKSGYTLVEVMMVVVIMGILSAVGVAGLQRAVANARIKDAAVNTAAFVERVANLASQRNEVLCLRVDPHSDQNLLVVRDLNGECSNPNGGIVATFQIDAPCRYIDFTECHAVETDWFSRQYQANNAFKPRFGLSAAPPHGGICIRYGQDDVYGAAVKFETLNRVKPMWRVGSESGGNTWSTWTDL